MENTTKHTVFIVDDDEAVRSSLQLLVMSLGWRVSAFSSGAECLDAVRGGARPDCFLLDLNVGSMTGPQIQQGLAGLNVDKPVVAMTGQPDSPLVQDSLEAGACEVMLKPFSDGQLQRALERSIAYPR